MPIDKADRYEEGGSWASMSEGWAETTVHANLKYLFLNKSGLLPYGSYVFMSAGYRGTKVDTLRVETKLQLKTLNENFNYIFNAIKQELLT